MDLDKVNISVLSMWELDDSPWLHNLLQMLLQKFEISQPSETETVSVPVPSCSIEASVEAIQAEVDSKKQLQGLFFHWFIMIKVILALDSIVLKAKSVSLSDTV